jgi:hypothetical protein
MKARTVLVPVVVGIVSLIAGVFATSWFMSRFIGSMQSSRAVATLAVDGLALQDIHDGDSDAAARLLQIILDGELITIYWEVKDGYVLTPQTKKVISRIKRLRDSSGYEPSDPAVRDTVREVFSLGSTDQ